MHTSSENYAGGEVFSVSRNPLSRLAVSGAFVIRTEAMRRSLRDRVRRRIRDRLDELHMTARELATVVGHGDAWISGILSGTQGLPWENFDAIADKLNLAPSELVRYDDAEVRELTPSEQRLLRHYRDWPDVIKDRWLDVLEFFSMASPDADAALLLMRLRQTPQSLRTPVLQWLLRLLDEGIPPEQLLDAGVLATGAGSPDTASKHHVHLTGRRGAARRRGADRKKKPK